DILPRAKHWVANNMPWVHMLLPGAVEDFGIRRRLRSDIAKAIDNYARRGNRAVADSWLAEKRNARPPDPATYAPIQTVDLSHAVRHLTCHLWPVSGYGAWEWTCDHLVSNAELFNGKRVIAIAESQETVRAIEVIDYLKDRDFDAEFLV